MTSNISNDSPESLRALALQCRRQARGASTAEVCASLNEIAANYEQLAAEAERAPRSDPAHNPLPRHG